MPETRFRLATLADEPKLRKLLRDIHMPGDIQVTFLCEPDFFKASKIQGRHADIIVHEDLAKGDIVSMGSRAIKPAYVNGELTNIGYLSSLRILEAYRGGIGLMRGYKMLKQLHQDNQATFYLSTIIGDNTHAQKLLESKRCGLPNYINLGNYCTCVINPRQIKPSQSQFEIRQATHNDLSAIVNFLNKYGKAKQFFPQYELDDFNKLEGLLAHLNISDIYLAIDNHAIVGTTALWNQKRIKQSLVNGYSKRIRMLLPAINFYAKLRQYPQLPKVNTIIDYNCLSLVCIKGDNTQIFQALLATALANCTANYVMAGFHQHDQLLLALSKIKHIRYQSKLYAVCWDDGLATVDHLDDRVPYLELGSL